MPITHTRNDWRRDVVEKPEDGDHAAPDELDDTIPGGLRGGGSGGSGGQGSIEGSGQRGGKEPNADDAQLPGTGDRIHRGDSGRDQVEGRRGGPQDEHGLQDAAEGTHPARD
jgi:hypothetical protein